MDLEQVLPELRAFVEERLIPLEPLLLREGFGAVEPKLVALRQEAARMGLFAPHLDAAFGGAGLSLGEFACVAEELGRSLLGHFTFNCQAPDSGNMELLARHGSEAQRARWLLPLAKGEIRSCFAMTEPERPGSNPTWLSATARRDGDDWVLDAHKWFTTGASGAAFAIVMAVSRPEAPERHRRASLFIVPMDAKGVRHLRDVSVMGDAGASWLSHAELRFEQVRIPESSRIGGDGEGFVLAQERLGPGRVHHCARWLGIGERALELMCRYAATREVAPGKPLGTQQLAQAALADSRVEIDAARLLLLRAVGRMEREGASAAREEISAAKLYGAGALQRVLDRAIQLHGALGMSDDLPLAFWYRHERAARIYDGADEVHRIQLARRMLARFGLEAKG